MRPARLLPWLLLPMLAACGGGNTPAPASSSGSGDAATTSDAGAAAAGDASTAAPATAQSQPAQPATQAQVSAADLPTTARPLLGTWSPDLSQCANGQSQTVITPTRFEGPGRSCSLSLTDNGDGTFTLACSGETVKMTPVFAPTGEGINLVFGDGSKQTVLRCSQ